MTQRIAQDHTALILGEHPVSYAELDRAVQIEISELKAGSPPSFVTLTAASNLDFVARLLAALSLEVPVALFSPDALPTETEKLLRLLQEPLHPKTALILFTSGSSGSPKGVQLSQANIRANTAAVIESLRFEEIREQTLFLPLHYSFGLLGQLLPALEIGATSRLLDGFSTIVPIIDPNSATGMWSGVPSHWEAVLRIAAAKKINELALVRQVVSAGAKLSNDLRNRLRKLFPNATIYNNYGLTECSPRVLSISSEDPAFFTDAVGYPVRGIELRLETDGELSIRGPQVMLGYLGDATGTQEKLREGYLRTGDLAIVSPSGLVSIQGRKDLLFNIGGERTSIVEIEEALRKIDGVRDAAILQQDDALRGTRIIALIVFVSSGTPLRKSLLLQQVAKYLSPHKIPSDFFIVDELPRSDRGKLQRSALLALSRRPMD